MLHLTPRQTLKLLALWALVLAVSGFVLEYGFNVLPCHMCWWQRYMHYAILAASLAGLAHPRLVRPALMAIILAAVTGLCIAVWQYAAQHGWLPFPASCTSSAMPTYAAAEDLLAAMQTTKVIPCDKETFTLLGLSLAAWNIPAMLFAIALSTRSLFRR